MRSRAPECFRGLEKSVRTRISIIVPVFNEAPLIRPFFEHLRERAPEAEVIVADGGSSDGTKLRVELWVDGAIARTAAAPLPGGDTLRPQSWDLTDLRGKMGTLVLVDDAVNGHLDVDDVWLWNAR